jgi:hypothetical protein
MHPASQRVDIVEVVNEFLEQQTDDRDAMFESVKRRRPLRARRAEPIDPIQSAAARPTGTASEPWYVVIDEIVENTVTFEAWPWPTIDPATRFLSFDLGQAKRKTVDRDDLQAVVNQRRAERDQSATADRPLRIGDVFEVRATKIRNPDTWNAVIDDTRRKRREAQAALHAMAAPPHFTTSEELETIGKRIEEESRQEQTNRATQAFPAV